MQPPAPASASPPGPDHGLPPVQPPSATMMFRLFLVPFLIVAVLVALYLAGQTFFGKLWGTRSPEKVLRDLDNPNPEVRWRAAADLAQELPRSDDLAVNAWFAVELADRLHTALQEAAGPEKEFAAGADALGPAEREARLNRDLVPRRNLITYLGASLGHFAVPAGAPLLSRLATQTGGMEPEALAESRRRALVALAALGEKLTGYDRLSDAEKDRIEAQLDESNPRWAAPCRAYLRKRRQGKADSFGVAAVIERCATDDDPSLRMYAAFAANFWAGDGPEEARIETTLAALSRDPGTGAEVRNERLARNPDAKESRAVTQKPGYEVQVNANLALARRGSPLVRFDLFGEMLDPEALRSVFQVRSRDGKVEPDEALVVFTLKGSLRALAELARKRPQLRPRLDALRPRVEALAADPATADEAARTLTIVWENP